MKINPGSEILTMNLGAGIIFFVKFSEKLGCFVYLMYICKS